MRRETGNYVVSTSSGEPVWAFVPRPLPPGPPLEMTTLRKEALSRALMELARLRVACLMAPGPEWLTYGFVRREAVLRSRIEGVQAPLTDLPAFEAEAPGQAPVGRRPGGRQRRCGPRLGEEAASLSGSSMKSLDG